MSQCLRIAVADDEPDMRDYYRRILPRLGHRVVGVSATGAELLDQCRECRPDLVITDVKMPDMDGIEAAIRLTRDQPTPVIVVSALHDPETIGRATAEPTVTYLAKPIRQAELGPVITQAVRRFEQWQAGRKDGDGIVPTVSETRPAR
ncbi:MAG: response regulator [Gemmataceae bacterium]